MTTDSAAETVVETVAEASTHESDIARKIWLAGVGAYGRMFTETQGAVGKLAANANEAFDQLVARGEEVEDKVRETISKSGPGERVVSIVEQAKSFRAEQRAALEARITKVRKTVAQSLSPLNLGALAEAVDKLSAQVEVLTEEVADLKAAKAAARAKKPAGEV